MQDINDKLEERIQRMVEMRISSLDIMHGELKSLMLEAEQEYLEAKRIEEEDDYSDAMQSMERKYWEGMCDAYSHLYKLTYDLSFAEAERDK